MNKDRRDIEETREKVKNLSGHAKSQAIFAYAHIMSMVHMYYRLKADKRQD